MMNAQPPTTKRQRLSNTSPALGEAMALVHHQGQDGADDLVAIMAARGGMIQELDDEVSALRKLQQQQALQLEQKDAELSSLRMQLTTWRAVKDAEAASLTSNNKQLTEQLSREIVRNKTLESQLQKTQADWNNAKLQAEQLQQRLSDAQQHAATTSSYSELTVRDLQQQLASAQRAAADRSRLLQQSLQLEKDKLQSEQESHAATQRQLSDARQQLTAAVARVGEAEAAAAAAQGRAVRAEMQAGAMAGSDTQVLLRKLQEQIKQQSQQLATAQEVLSQAQAVPGLQQQLAEVQEALRSAQHSLEEQQQHKAEADKLQQELDLWKTAFKTTLGLEYPSPSALSALKTKQQQLEQQCHAAQVELLSLRSDLAEVNAALTTAETARAAAAAQLQTTQQQLQASELRVRLACTERDGLRNLVDLFEREQQGDAAKADKAAEEAAQQAGTEGAGSNEAGATAAAAAAVAAAAKSSAAAAVAKAEGLQELVQQLQAAQSQLQEQLGAAVAGEAAAKAAEAAAAAELKLLTRECDDLGLKVAALESQLAGGDYDPTTTRVLHLAANPAAEVERLRQAARLDRLEAENSELRHALAARAATAAAAPGPTGEPMDHDAAPGSSAAAAAAAGAGGAGHDDPSVMAAIAAAEIKVLHRKLELAEKQAATMKDVFKQRVRAFRESCRFLFGYRVDMVSEPWPDVLHAPTMYTLTSCFGSKQDVLMFRYHPNAEPQYSLIKTPLSQRLAQDVNVFIDNFKSIPAFTANHTMTLFQQTTNT